MVTYNNDLLLWLFEIYRYMVSLWCITETYSVIGQFYFKSKEKRSDMWSPEAGSEGGLKIQTSSYKTINIKGVNVTST